MKKTQVLKAMLTAAFVTIGTVSTGAELSYAPLHPAFGGDPNNFNALFTLAQTQNQFVPESSGSGGGVPTINFPPITIDLGGVGSPPVAAAVPAATTARNYQLLDLE